MSFSSSYNPPPPYRGPLDTLTEEEFAEELARDTIEMFDESFYTAETERKIALCEVIAESIRPEE